MHKYLFALILLIACMPEIPGYRPVTLVLKDNRGTINMTVPVEWDTTFQWTSHSDCGLPCEEIKYRFQPKKYPIHMENDWFDTKMPTDSVAQLTITHEAMLPKPGKAVPYDSGYRRQMRQFFTREGFGNYIILDSLIVAGQHRIPAVGMQTNMDQTRIFRIYALVEVNAGSVQLEFERLSSQEKKDDEIFWKKVCAVIMSIRIQ